MSAKIPNRKRMVRDLPTVDNIVDLLGYVKSHGDKVCYKYFEQGKLLEMKYSEVYELTIQIAAAFSKLQLAGKRVAVIGDTSPQWICTYMGAVASGTIIIPMDKELEVSQIEKFLEGVEAEAIVYSKSFNEKFAGVIESHPTLKHFIPISADGVEANDKVIPFTQFVEIGKENVNSGYEISATPDRESMCEMLFTSGTTGTSKCVMLCQKNIFAAVSAAIQTVCFSKDDVLVSVLPVHHTYELMCLLAELAFGMTTCINDSLRHVLKNFQRFKPTGLVLVPMFLQTMYKKVWSEAEKSGRDKKLKTGIKLSNALRAVGIDARRKLFKSVLDAFGGNLDHIICGGAKLSPDLIVGFEELGISVFEGFGITECSPLVSVTPYYARKLGAIGPNVPCCTVRIDPNGEETPEGYPMGEVQVKGDNVMLGYYNNPEANADAFTEDGWFRTGDVGYLDKDGYIYITGRIKFVIIDENGKNVFPEEIEEYLDIIDTISECCVIGRKNEGSEAVVITAVVYPDYSKFPEGTDEATIKDTIWKAITAVNKKLPPYKHVKQLDIRTTEFEKTTTKKIKRQLVK